MLADELRQQIQHDEEQEKQQTLLNEHAILDKLVADIKSNYRKRSHTVQTLHKNVVKMLETEGFTVKYNSLTKYCCWHKCYV